MKFFPATKKHLLRIFKSNTVKMLSMTGVFAFFLSRSFWIEANTGLKKGTQLIWVNVFLSTRFLYHSGLIDVSFMYFSHR